MHTVASVTVCALAAAYGCADDGGPRSPRDHIFQSKIYFVYMQVSPLGCSHVFADQIVDVLEVFDKVGTVPHRVSATYYPHVACLVIHTTSSDFNEVRAAECPIVNTAHYRMPSLRHYDGRVDRRGGNDVTSARQTAHI